MTTIQIFSRLYLYSYGLLPDLHSFPTRRSSDLVCGSSGPARGRRSRSGCSSSARSSQPRSEEHTSELQSRFDLVCRLLLEKKNILQKLRHSLLKILTYPNTYNKL